MTLNGTQEFLNSKQIGANGLPLGLIDDDGELSDLEDRLRVDKQLPGSNRGDLSARVTRPEIRVMSIQFSPNSTSFAAASTEGLLIYN
ncbi:unnamed protein product [[Candida] boidinii]|nr:unnamed protein product [[Candida] boidinii]